MEKSEKLYNYTYSKFFEFILEKIEMLSDINYLDKIRINFSYLSIHWNL